MTDAQLYPIEEINKNVKYDIKNWDESVDKELKDLVERLNDGEIID